MSLKLIYIIWKNTGINYLGVLFGENLTYKLFAEYLVNKMSK